jgi:sarcosine reductase
MKLQLHEYRIAQVDFGATTRLQEHTLLINADELIDTISGYAGGVAAEVAICRPGEDVRITNILDIVEPRAKSGVRRGVFSGFLGPPKKAGKGITKVLQGVAIIEVGAIPRVQEGLIDMGGPGARYSPFAKTNNVVIVCTPTAGMEMLEFETLTRLAGLRASTCLAETALQMEPDEIEIFELDLEDSAMGKGRGLNRIAYVYMLQSQGFVRDTFFYGRSMRELSPTLVHPNEIMDGAIVSGNYVVPANRNPTYLHLNNPLIRKLSLLHGKDLLFSGVVICNEQSRLRDKESTAREVAEILDGLGVDGVIITKEGGGNADADLMLMCRTCESRGIRTVLIGNEAAGKDGSDPSLADSTPEADAFVSAGNIDETVRLDPVEKVIGRGVLPGIEGDLRGGLTVPVARINGAANLLGYGELSSRLY